jgi:hypothetical protein
MNISAMVQQYNIENSQSYNNYEPASVEQNVRTLRERNKFVDQG